MNNINYEDNIICPYCNEEDSSENYSGLDKEISCSEVICPNCRKNFQVKTSISISYEVEK